MPNEKGRAEPSPLLVVIVGPTAVGKTELAMGLAVALGGEVVSADSRQVYRYLDIGTAKPTPGQRASVPHHLIDIVAPDQVLTLAQYQEKAYLAIAEVISRGRLPILTGGTGQYVAAVTEGWTIPRVTPNPARRAELYAVAGTEGAEALHARLVAVDPVAAAKIDARNVRRVVRALEVHELTGKPISDSQTKQPPPYRIVRIGLTLDRAELYRRVDDRLETMMAAGLVDEVRALACTGYGFDLPALSGLGYRQIGMYLRGEVGLDEAVRLVKRHTRRFVRQQYNWFRLSDDKIHWFDAGSNPVASVLGLVRRMM